MPKQDIGASIGIYIGYKECQYIVARAIDLVNLSKSVGDVIPLVPLDKVLLKIENDEVSVSIQI